MMVIDCADCGGHIQGGEGLTAYVLLDEHGGSRAVCFGCFEKAKLIAAQRQRETVNHPPHYNQIAGIACIDVVEWCSFNIGSAMTCLWRFEHKNGIEDLEKSIWYIRREIDRLKKLHKDAW